MTRTCGCRLLILFLVLAVPFLATVGVAQSHVGVKSPHESHCRICLAAHSGTNALSSSTVELHFTPVLTSLVVQTGNDSSVWLQFRPNQDRAPPAV
jgi:hypothetical protein